MSAPRVDQVNIVVGDLLAAADFLAGLGVELPAATDEWAAHHQNVPSATQHEQGHEPGDPAFGVDLDSSAFAQAWGGLPQTFNGVVLNVRVDERAGVDRLHELALSLGGVSLKAPYDAFWGARYAVAEGPGPIVVGLMSPRDPAHQDAPPDPATLG